MKTVFNDGDPSLGILGTRVLAAFLNKIFAHRHDGKDEDGSAPIEYAHAAGTANAIEVSLMPGLTSHVEGMPIRFRAVYTNTGSCTVAINDMDPVLIRDSGFSLLKAGAIGANTIVEIVYNGSDYVLVSDNYALALAKTAGFVGQVAWSASINPPAGWLECNGAAISRTTYAALFAAIGTTWGLGDGASTFNLPDLRGEFIRGWDHGRGIDPGRAFATAQSDELESHSHSWSYPYSSNNENESPSIIAIGQNNQGTLNVNVTNTGGTETRPRNVDMMPVIKY